MTRPASPFPWERVLDRLSALYHTGDWRVPYLRNHASDPFQVLIGTVLSQRTRDANTDRASAALFARYPTAPALARAPLPTLERILRPVGFYRAKARNIRADARAILTQHGGVVPDSLEELLALPGVGRKTANCTLVFGFGRPAIPVDTHVHRIANRLGVVRTRDPAASEAALAAVVPKEYWIPLNPLLVQHGQNLCRPREPRCTACPIATECATGRARRTGRPTPRPEDRPKRRRALRGRPAPRRAKA